MGYTFVLPEDSVAFAAQHFPPAAYECISGIISMFQNLREEVVRKADVEQEDLHVYRIGRSQRQTAMVFSLPSKSLSSLKAQRTL